MTHTAPLRAGRATPASARGTVHFLDMLPIDEVVEPRFEIFRPRVLPEA